MNGTKQQAKKAVKTKTAKYQATKLKLNVPNIPTKGRTKASRKPEKKFEILSAQTFSDEQARDVLLFMGDHGVSLKAACEVAGLNYFAVWGRVHASDVLRNLDRNVRGLYLKNAVRSMNEIVDTEADPNRARLKCDNIKWEASRVLRHEFGDHVTVAGDESAPLVTKLVVGADEIVRRIRGTKPEEE